MAAGQGMSNRRRFRNLYNRLFKAEGKAIVFETRKKIPEGNHPPSDVTGWCCSIGKKWEKRIFYRKTQWHFLIISHGKGEDLSHSSKVNPYHFNRLSPLSGIWASSLFSIWLCSSFIQERACFFEKNGPTSVSEVISSIRSLWNLVTSSLFWKIPIIILTVGIPENCCFLLLFIPGRYHSTQDSIWCANKEFIRKI